MTDTNKRSSSSVRKRLSKIRLGTTTSTASSSLPPRRNRASAEQTQTKSGLGGASSLTSSDVQTNGTDVETNARGESPEPPLCRASYSYEATTWDLSTAKPK
uniref:Uncharacterized protein n=1 Tax=Vespula pensylvanica TaxID=30213 RepID=A0A834NEY2_VESPE|nr:hypothetical protein H0235_014488 [Vespula pensylvanica]